MTEHNFDAALHAILAAVHTDPVEVATVGVHDGDTFGVYVAQWPKLFQHWRIRLAHLDAPELNDPRPDIAAIAEKARARLVQLLAAGPVVLTSQKFDEYGGRLVCQVTAGGVDVGIRLLAEGLARSYEGHGPKPW